MVEDLPQRFSGDLDQADGEIEASINASPHFKRLMQTFCREIGPRPAGSPAMRRGAEFLAEQWKELGAHEVHTEELPVRAWEDGGAELQVLSPQRRKYPSIQSINSASGIVSGSLVNAGTLTLSELSRLGGSIRGSVVLLTKVRGISGGKYIPLQKVISLTEAAGAIGALFTGWHEQLPSADFVDHLMKSESTAFLNF